MQSPLQYRLAFILNFLLSKSSFGNGKNILFVVVSVDGGWSDWSDWTMCNHIGDQRSGDRCLCRARACNNPRPFYGGLECDGEGVEVRNCTGEE